MTSEDAPDIRILWDRKAHARKEYRCDRCGECLTAGERYSSLGLLEDGTFRHVRTHIDAGRYPSGCPPIGARDRDDEAWQFAADQETYFPQEPPR